MNILVIDDRTIISQSMSIHLENFGFKCCSSKSLIETTKYLEHAQPEAILLNLDMDRDAKEILFYLRNVIHSNVPVLGITNQDEVSEIFMYYHMGLTDHVVRPINFTILSLKLLRFSNIPISERKIESLKRIHLCPSVVGIVIPCYNEAERIESKTFIDFIDTHAGYHLCFVNDGSSDHTIDVLNEMCEGRTHQISVIDLKTNRGKAEAVRQGALYLCQDSQFDIIGFLDADLATDFNDFKNLVNSLNRLDHMMTVGSRIQRMGANIERTSKRQLISKTINQLIRSIIQMPFQDTQCGAKVMTIDLAKTIMQKPFKTSWLFDLELFIRIRAAYPHLDMSNTIYEYPLEKWIHKDGSKLSGRDAFKILWQLFTIKRNYT